MPEGTEVVVVDDNVDVIPSTIYLLYEKKMYFKIERVLGLFSDDEQSL